MTRAPGLLVALVTLAVAGRGAAGPSAATPAELLARGRAHARVAEYREAAAALEEYATKYPGEQEAEAALGDAAAYRRAIGDDRQAIGDIHAYVKRYGAKAPDRAAAAMFSIAAIHERGGAKAEVLKALRAYVKTYGARGGGDRLIHAYARIGQLLWDESCPVKAVDGACVSVKAAARAERCGPAARPVVAAVKRDARKAKEALASFATAVKLYEAAGGTFPGGDGYDARHWYAAAVFHLAEVDHEAFLGLAFPTGLDFDPAKPAVMRDSSKRFEAWFKESDRTARTATQRYQRLVFEVKDPTWAIAATARMGQITDRFSGVLATAEVPPFIVKMPDAREAYCSRLMEVAEPYEASSVDGFAACLRVSTQLGQFDDWSRLCERELARLRPEEFPLARERWAKAELSISTVAAEGEAAWSEPGAEPAEPAE